MSSIYNTNTVHDADGHTMACSDAEAKALQRAGAITQVELNAYSTLGNWSIDECQDTLFDWYAEAAEDREIHGTPEDTPCLESGRDNCDDAGTGEGQYHGRM